MKPFIDFNTEERAEAKIEIEKPLPKNMNPSFFGKSMENARDKTTI